ncbi:class I SAM-dependent methyltransferase [Roseateles oligotrophus]|uniref:Class I SAM-dependent methyltransferase n=1 Tax=Roseateles oligotrophus TaxID=1769250 RepID=A0ABT2YFV8_9BURK|nr:class I SAM-dependent methyltransferase [Roseateles oligotrophus]MCV2368943.1 class I SAM-dependent methyltransferase [Roseateles oligotrophus]
MSSNLTPSPVKTYQDIVPDYQTYVGYQTDKWASHEITVPKWEQGQQRYLHAVFAEVPRKLRIADIACGDGVGLRHFKQMGFTDVVGVELNPSKLDMAEQSGYQVVERDMHDLCCFEAQSFDIVYSSHSLEHAYQPSKVLAEFHRILRPAGALFVVLPYPDMGDWNDEAHGAKYELGTNIKDNGASVVQYFERAGFKLLSSSFDSFREPEIWLKFEKN